MSQPRKLQRGVKAWLVIRKIKVDQAWKNFEDEAEDRTLMRKKQRRVTDKHEDKDKQIQFFADSEVVGGSLGQKGMVKIDGAPRKEKAFQQKARQSFSGLSNRTPPAGNCHQENLSRTCYSSLIETYLGPPFPLRNHAADGTLSFLARGAETSRLPYTTTLMVISTSVCLRDQRPAPSFRARTTW